MIRCNSYLFKTLSHQVFWQLFELVKEMTWPSMVSYILILFGPFLFRNIRGRHRKAVEPKTKTDYADTTQNGIPGSSTRNETDKRPAAEQNNSFRIGPERLRNIKRPRESIVAFVNCYQQEDQSIKDFMTELQTYANTTFESMSNDAIENRVIVQFKKVSEATS